MKKIEDYINKEVAITCKTEEEWNKIQVLLNVNMAHKHQEDDCIWIAHKSWSNLKYAKAKTNKIYPASDFLEEDYQNVLDIEVGDTIKCISENISKVGTTGTAGYGWKPNLEAVVTSIDDNKTFKIYFLETGNGVYSDAVRLIKRKEVEVEVSEYVECIEDPKWGSSSDVKVGTIWKTCTKSYPKGKYRIVWPDDCGQTTAGKEHCFKPSTKEAFDLQNNKFLVKKGDYLYCHTSLVMNNGGKIEAIAGKWYKSENDNCFTNESGSINHGTTNNPGEWFKKQALSNGPLTDLSEIQEFLPDGHVDKIVKSKHTFTNIYGFTFEEDKIYLYDNDILVRFKHEHKPVNKTLKTNSNEANSYKTTSDYAFSLNNVRIATQEEIEWFELCEAAGKFIEKPIKQMEKNEFKKGDYIVVLKDSSISNNWKDYIFKQSKNTCAIYPIIKVNGDVNNSDSFTHFHSKDVWRYATKEEIAEYNRLGKPFDVTTLNKIEVKMTKEEILEKAKRDYPVGTVFKAARGSKKKYEVKSNSKFRHYEDEAICILDNGNGTIYFEEEWAEIVSKPEETINTYGLSVGMNLPEKIIRDWSEEGLHYILDRAANSDIIWSKQSAFFCGDRSILSFKELHGIIGFEVSGTGKIFLKAEGFKEFMDNFDKPKVEEKWVPKVGDWVVRLNDAHLGIKVGQVCQITKINGMGHCIFKEQNPNGSHSPKNIRKALPHEIPVEPPIHSSIDAIQAECKRKFPIGCTYKDYDGIEYVLRRDDETYKIVSGHVYGGNCQCTLYHEIHGYAELISLPEVKSNDFILPKESSKITNQKYSVNALKNISNLVVRCKNAEQGNKIALIFDKDYKTHDFQDARDFIVWKNAWNLTKDKYPYQTLIEYDDIIFENDKLGIDPITEKPTLIKPINKIELRTKKVISQHIKKEKKQLVIIKTKQLKLN